MSRRSGSISRWSATCTAASGLCGHCQLGPTLICRDGPVYPTPQRRAAAGGARAVSRRAKPKLAVWKFASCDGCQLSLLDCEDELLALAGRGRDRRLPRGDRARRRRARTTSRSSRARSRRRTTPSGSARSGAVEGAGHDRRLRDRRRHPGAAQLRRRATSSSRPSTPRPSTSRRSRPRRRSRRTSRSTSSCAAARSTSASCSRCITAFLHGRKPNIPSTSVCTECKRRGTVCVMVAHGTPCLGPVTHAGCGALCPAYNRGCYGCFGPMETPNTASLVPLLQRARAGATATSSASSAPSTPARGLPRGGAR